MYYLQFLKSLLGRCTSLFNVVCVEVSFLDHLISRGAHIRDLPLHVVHLILQVLLVIKQVLAGAEVMPDVLVVEGILQGVKSLPGLFQVFVVYVLAVGLTELHALLFRLAAQVLPLLVEVVQCLADVIRLVVLESDQVLAGLVQAAQLALVGMELPLEGLVFL